MPARFVHYRRSTALVVEGFRRPASTAQEGDGDKAQRSHVDLASAAANRLLFLPHYSRDLNPIENTFARLKAMLPEAGEHRFRPMVAHQQAGRSLPTEGMR